MPTYALYIKYVFIYIKHIKHRYIQYAVWVTKEWKNYLCPYHQGMLCKEDCIWVKDQRNNKILKFSR